MKFAKPILKECPICGVKGPWYWSTHEKEVDRILEAIECTHKLDPLDLDVKPYAAWKADPNSYYPQSFKKVASKTEEDLLSIVPKSRKIAHS